MALRLVRGNYIPDRDHLVWMDFDPGLGHEQLGRRPALVLTKEVYNKTGLLVCVPITTNPRPKWPFMVPVAVTSDKNSFAIADQVKCVDWRERNIEFIRRAERHEAGRVRGLLLTLL